MHLQISGLKIKNLFYFLFNHLHKNFECNPLQISKFRRQLKIKISSSHTSQFLSKTNINQKNTFPGPTLRLISICKFKRSLQKHFLFVKNSPKNKRR